MIRSKNSSEKIFFDRYSATKNTFFVGNLFLSEMNSFYSRLSRESKLELVRYLCGGIFDQKSDGLFFIKPNSILDFEWEFYNSDGSIAEMCGNAARCASLAFHKFKKVDHAAFKTGAGEISSQISLINETEAAFQARVTMTQVSEIKEVIVDGHKGLFVNTGVPHFVIPENPDFKIGRLLRSSSQFGSAGANITFVKDHAQSLEAVTFERGVENFTQACGTGAVAAAVWKNHVHKKSEIRSVQMPGGELLVENAVSGMKPFLTGDVKMDYRMTDFGYERFLKEG